MLKRQAKSKHFEAQMSRVFQAFSKQPKTMLMVSIETGILRANICRYVAEWRTENRIHEVKKGICPISKHGATFFITSNESSTANKAALSPEMVELETPMSHEN